MVQASFDQHFQLKHFEASQHHPTHLKMAFKLIVLAAALAVANAGFIGAPAAYGYAAAPAAYGYAAPAAYGYAAPAVAVGTPTLTSQSSNTLRTYGNQGQISHEAKTIQTPYSSVSRSDVRVSNDAQILAHAPVAHAYAAPVAHAYAAPAAYAAPVAHAAYAAPVAHAAYAAPVAHAAYAAPVAHAAYAAPVAKAVAPGLLGVAYSAAPVVSHMTYTGSYGVQYAY